MTENENQLEQQRVWCRRLEQQLPISEHANCLYCFGKKGEIVAGEHAEFCDFKPGEDPINFGFPPDTSRNLTD